MQYRIVRKDAFRLVGLGTRVPLVYEGVNPATAAFAESVTAQQREQLAELSDQDPRGVLSVSDGFSEGRDEGSELDYYVAVATSGPAPEGFQTLEVGPTAWLVLSSSGPFPHALQQLWPQAFGQWFPANPYRLGVGPEMVRAEFNQQGDRADAELWLPVEPTS